MRLGAQLYSVVGTLGYLYALEETCADVTLNFPSDDVAAAIVRGCIALSLMLTFPMLVLPCRRAIFSLEEIMFGYGSDYSSNEGGGSTTSSRRRKDVEVVNALEEGCEQVTCVHT